MGDRSEHNNLILGDIVTLNSQGPIMTVEELRPDGWVGCVWFRSEPIYMPGQDGDDARYHDVNRAEFRACTLTRLAYLRAASTLTDR